MQAASQIINKVLQDKDYDIIKTNCLEASQFEGLADEFNFIVDHYKKFGNVPDTFTFLAQFQDFDLIEVNETDDYLIDKLHEECGFYKFREILPQVNDKLKEDSRLAYEYLMSELPKLKPHTVCKGHDIIEEANERYEHYINRCSSDVSPTISTGFKELDDILDGWEPGDELVTLVARTNTGKSWLQMKFLTEAWKQGKRVGLYSGEMNHINLGYRFDALFEHFSNKDLTKSKQIKKYKPYIESLKGRPGCFNIITQKEFGGKPTVQKIRNFIEENDIEIMGIDQLSLMEDCRAQRGDPLRMKMGHISEDLFLLSSEYKIPILCIVQANRAAITKDESESSGLENIKESDDIAANSSKCISFKQDKGFLIMNIIKNRSGKVGDKLIYTWDIDTGYFEHCPVYSTDTAEKIKKDNEKRFNNCIPANSPF